MHNSYFYIVLNITLGERFLQETKGYYTCVYILDTSNTEDIPLTVNSYGINTHLH